VKVETEKGVIFSYYRWVKAHRVRHGPSLPDPTLGAHQIFLGLGKSGGGTERKNLEANLMRAHPLVRPSLLMDMKGNCSHALR
jgi:hypothetical protein